MMKNSHQPSRDDLDIDLTIDDIFPPADADAAASLNPKSLCVSKSGQIDPNPNEFGQSGSQLIETPVIKSSPESHHDSVDMSTIPEAAHSPENHSSSGSPVLWTNVSDFVVNSEGDEKVKSRRVRNRESAQLYRQRKKDYVEELEDKVRRMHSIIQHLTWENAALKSQMGSTGVPAQILPPPPGMHPWMPYMVKPQRSQVPLVPIPRLKPQAMAPPAKRSKKLENTETEKKTKKVASITYLGLLFFMLLFGGLVPMVNLRYGGLRNGYIERHHGRVLTVDGQISGSSYSGHHNRRDYTSNCSPRGSNGNDPLMASLNVPRNDKLVKIDGNLIIQSVLASEKAMASHRNGETGFAVPGDLAGRHPHHYRSPADGDNSKAKSTIQQWFLEGVAGPMLSSGMCTEVFQFDASSSPGVIVPAATVRNVSMELTQNATRRNKGRNRRILDGLSVPVTGVSHDISEEHERESGKKDDLAGNSSLSSMIVSVLVDPIEAGDGDGDGMIGQKSTSRIYVVVLIDNVKYVTYSCMLPFKGTVPLVTT